ncbi:hypothetical protein BDZ89DRAFT_3779 [Hymenopellis radicata]|nr:hypothetical protein BDZ89DRAFT_3779 [Hymenopellis radicata]
MSPFLKPLQDGGDFSSISSRQGLHHDTFVARVLSNIRKIVARLLWVLRYRVYWTRRQHVQQMNDSAPVETQLASGHSCYMNAPVHEKPPRSNTLMSQHDVPTQLTTGLIAKERHELPPPEIPQPVDSAESPALSHDTIQSTSSSLDQHDGASSTQSLSEKSPSSESAIGLLFYPVAPCYFERYQRPFVVPNKFIRHEIPRATVEFSSRYVVSSTHIAQLNSGKTITSGMGVFFTSGRRLLLSLSTRVLHNIY